jgi:hypothetical protein
MTTEPPPTASKPRLSRWIDRHGRERVRLSPPYCRRQQNGPAPRRATLAKLAWRALAALWRAITKGGWS